MSLRKAFRSRKFSKSFRKLKLSDEDQARGGDRRVVRDSDCADSSSSPSSSSWSDMLTELLGEIIRRVEASEDKWPHRKNVVACACVCKRWRDITKEIARSPSYSGKITFPSCLKQPPPRLRPSLQVPPCSSFFLLQTPIMHPIYIHICMYVCMYAYKKLQ
ncbi:hypothetical protein ACFX1X_006192 [Malus domestica]